MGQMHYLPTLLLANFWWVREGSYDGGLQYGCSNAREEAEERGYPYGFATSGSQNCTSKHPA
jgi:hypothetical protein